MVAADAAREEVEAPAVERPLRAGSEHQLLALQRSIGNAGVARLVASGRRPLQRACCASCAAGHRCEDEEIEERGAAALRASVAGRRAVARYAHQDCSEDDLRNHIWPADYLARQMVRKAVRALSASPIEPAVSALFPKYFMTSTPSVARILHVLDQVEVEFRDNDYTYECEDDCDSDDNGYTWSGLLGAMTSSHIHLCMTNFQSRSNECLARTIVHEFTHRYAGTDDNGYCKTGCGYSSCPSDLTPDKALENADSYACFVYELWPMTLLTASAEPARAADEPAVALA
jgi:lysine-specific metallo-endopeptidase family protein